MFKICGLPRKRFSKRYGLKRWVVCHLGGLSLGVLVYSTVKDTCTQLRSTIITHTTHCGALWNTATVHILLWIVKHSYVPQWSHTLHTVVRCETQLRSAMITYTTHCSALWNTAMFRNDHIHYTLLCVVKHSYGPQWSHTLHTVVRYETQLRSTIITYTHYTL